MLDGEGVDHWDGVGSELVGQGLEGYVEGAGTERAVTKMAGAEAVQREESNTCTPNGCGDSVMHRTSDILEELGE